MAKPKYPKEFLELCKSVTAKRPKTVIDHILKHGHITTEELRNKYGYDHPPRAARAMYVNLAFNLKHFVSKQRTVAKLPLIGSPTQQKNYFDDSAGALVFPKK